MQVHDSSDNISLSKSGVRGGKKESGRTTVWYRRFTPKKSTFRGVFRSSEERGYLILPFCSERL
jgi:hypothetical protein